MTSIDIEGIYHQLKENGFYENIYVKLPGRDRQDDDTINIPRECTDRESGIEHISTIGDDFEIFKSPCRIGRASKWCSKKIINDTLVEGGISALCPLCSLTDTQITNPCEPLNKYVLKPLEAPFILLPNAYPYLKTQFLITTQSHYMQMGVMGDPSLVSSLFSIFNNILIPGNGYIFFNGICGNSLEHFHCQYTTSDFPIFNGLSQTYNGYYKKENSLLKGYVLLANSPNDVNNVIQYITSQNLTYNFIVRKTDANLLQFIFFVRHCVICPGIVDLNFGSTELAGVVVVSNTFPNTLDQIHQYIDATHNDNNYNGMESILSTIIAGRRVRKRKTSKRKHKHNKRSKKSQSKKNQYKKYK